MYFMIEPKIIEQIAFTTPKQIMTYPMLWIPIAHET